VAVTGVSAPRKRSTHDFGKLRVGASGHGAVGVAVGSLIRSQLGATVGIFVWAFFVESTIGGLYNSIDPYLPFTAATTLAGSRLGGGGFGFGGGSSATPLPFLAATALVTGVLLLISTLAATTTVKQDIT
jgi:hypothetical protein